MKTLIAVLALCFSLTSHAFAQSQHALIGSWKLVSIVSERDGKRSEPWGPNPQGVLVMNGNGTFSQIQMRSDRAKYATNNRMRGTDEENKATAQGVLAYYGTYSANAAGNELTFKIEASSFPNFNGTEGKRPFTLKGDELTTINPAPAGGAEIRLVWRREK